MTLSRDFILVTSGIAAAVAFKTCSNKLLKHFRKSSKKRVAVVLAGCGVFDGAEIQEAVSCLIHLSHCGAEVQCFAPDMLQNQVVNHLTSETCVAPSSERNVLVESARIARGDIKPLHELEVEDFDALIFPGGFGVAKHFCTFARDSTKANIHPEIETVLKSFRANGKAIGLCCISPILAALCFPGCSITLGSITGAGEAARDIGAIPSQKSVTEIHVDLKNKLVTTPAYMCDDATVHDVFVGIGKMINKTLALA